MIWIRGGRVIDPKSGRDQRADIVLRGAGLHRYFGKKKAGKRKRLRELRHVLMLRSSMLQGWW